VVLSNLSLARHGQGEYADAEAVAKRAVAINRLGGKARAIDLAYALNGQGQAVHVQGRFDEAEKLYRESLAILEKERGVGHPDVSSVLNNLGLLCLRRGEHGPAWSHLMRSWAIAKLTLGPDHPDTVETQQHLAFISLDMGKTADAEATFLEVAAKLEKALGSGHPRVGNALMNYGIALDRGGKDAEAAAAFTRALSNIEASLGNDHPAIINLLDSHASLLARREQVEDAVKAFSHARRAARKHAMTTLPALSAEAKTAFLAGTFRGGWQAAVSLAAAHPANPKVVSPAAEWLANSKGVAQEAFAASELLKRAAKGPPDDPGTRLAQARLALAEARRAIPHGDLKTDQANVARLVTADADADRQAKSSAVTSGWHGLHRRWPFSCHVGHVLSRNRGTPNSLAFGDSFTMADAVDNLGLRRRDRNGALGSLASNEPGEGTTSPR
jgi:tetratricopeptide (TPR) repeat protein